MSATPDKNGRINGTTYPDIEAPSDAAIMLGRGRTVAESVFGLMLKANVQIMRPSEGDVLVVRISEDKLNDDEFIGSVLNKLSEGGFKGIPVFLPMDCRVHLEPGRLQSEDRGYRSTSVYGTDKSGNQDERGVFIGVEPNPLSESGDDDPVMK